MEVFVDLGLFELMAAVGITAIARAVYARKALGFAFLLVSVGLPTVLIFVAEDETARWLAALSLVTALVNAAVVLGAMQRGEVRIPELRPKNREDAPPPRER